MSKRKRRGVSRSTLGRRYQSDFINVTQRPRSLIIDPRCESCRGRGWIKYQWRKCKRCDGTGKDPEGDKWFANHDRVKTTVGPKHNQSPLLNNTFMQEIPPTIGVGSAEKGASSSTVKYADNNLPRRAVVEKIEQLNISARLTIIERMDKFTTIRKDVKSHLKLFFVGDKYCFVEEFETYTKRSMIYTGREYAIAKLYKGTIDWVEFL